MEGIEWVIGLSLIFTLALFMTMITYKDIESFFIWLTLFSGFGVLAGLLDLWVLILLIILLVGLIIRNKSGGND